MDDKSRAPVRIIRGFDPAAMLMNDLVHDRQAQAGAIFFRRDKGIEYCFQHVAWDATAGIADDDLSLIAPVRLIEHDRNGQRPSIRHGLYGVEKEVDQDLPELFSVHKSVDDGRVRMLVDNDLCRSQLGRHEIYGLGYDGIQIIPRALRFRRSSKLQEILQQLFDSDNFFDNDFIVFDPL